MPKFNEMTVEEVIQEARRKENEFAYNFLLEKYEGMIHGIIRKQNFYLKDGEYDDLVQEGLVGLYKAIKVYDPKKKHSSFEAFATLVIKRHIISAIKKSTRKKHKPLNERYSFDKTFPDNENLTMMDLLGNKEEVKYRSHFEDLDPEQQFILNETIQNQEKILNKLLSHQEKEIYDLRYIEGKSYKEIMEELGITDPKKVDNTVQRIKRKFERVKLLEEYEDAEIFNEDYKEKRNIQ